MAKRSIVPELEEIIESKIREIEPKAYADALAVGDALTICALAGDALSALKVREKTNRNDGFFVEMIQKTAGGRRGDAWCMWQQMTQIAFAEKKTGKVSRLPSTGSCAHLRSHAPKDTIVPLKDSLPGDVWILVRSNGLGHTGNFRGWKKYPTEAILNEGNTTAGVVGGKISREGGGSYRTERLTSEWKMAVRPFPPIDTKQVPKEEPASNPISSPGKLKLCILVGHSKDDGGATFALREHFKNEYAYNTQTAKYMVEHASKLGLETKVIFRDGIGRSGALSAARKFQPHATIELHFNAFNKKALGTCTLSADEKIDISYAHSIQKAVCAVFGREGDSRGVDVLKSGDRGYMNVDGLPGSANCLVEPFFGDNPSEARLAVEKHKAYSEALVDATLEWLKQMGSPKANAFLKRLSA